MKPILFNIDMVHAILDGRKTVTQRVAKKSKNICHAIATHNFIEIQKTEFTTARLAERRNQ